MSGRSVRRIIIFCAVLCMVLRSDAAAKPRYTYQFFGTFDTVVTVTAYTDSRDKFEEFARDFEMRMREYHELFDIYNNYENISNIKTINDNAGIQPIEVNPALMELLTMSTDFYKLTDGSFNIAMGPVLKLWHEAREISLASPENAVVPDADALESAAKLCDMDKLVLDKSKHTAYLTEAGMSLDVGAVAKGYAVEKAAVSASEKHEIHSYLINAGGNVKTGEPPPERAHWNVGLQNPAPDVFKTAMDVVYVSGMSVVTSADYQRFYMYDGERFGHIIDPDTLLPASRFRSVTVAGADSSICDILSTALYILPEEKGRELAETLGYSAYWMHSDGSVSKLSN